MPFALIFIGLIFMIAAVKGNHKDLFELLKKDFTGQDNFFVWVLAIIILVAIGNVEKLRPISNAFLGLIVLVIIIGNGKKGLFENFMSQLRAGTGGGSSNISETVSAPATMRQTGDAIKSIASGALVKEAQKRINDVGNVLGGLGFLK